MTHSCWVLTCGMSCLNVLIYICRFHVPYTAWEPNRNYHLLTKHDQVSLSQNLPVLSLFVLYICSYVYVIYCYVYVLCYIYLVGASKRNVSAWSYPRYLSLSLPLSAYTTLFNIFVDIFMYIYDPSCAHSNLSVCFSLYWFFAWYRQGRRGSDGQSTKWSLPTFSPVHIYIYIYIYIYYTHAAPYPSSSGQPSI